jgi:quinol-cytochrome oxidoreductase complex cytochrome b subunit
LHVFILPGALLAFLSVHLRLVLGKGINEQPKPGVLVKRETYEKHYGEIIKREGVPFVPGVINKDIVASGVMILLIVGLALFVGPNGPGTPANPTIEIADAKPDYPFLWLFAAAALLPNGSEPFLFFVFPLVATLLLFLLPFISNEGEKHYGEIIKREGVPFVPAVINKDVIASGVIVILIVFLALFVGPNGPGVPANPTIEIADAKPDTPFLWLFALAALLPNGSEPWLFFVFPTLASLLLFLLPFITNEGEKHWRRRPVSVAIVVLSYLGIGMLTYEAMTGPWSPHMDAWSGLPIKAEYVKGRAPLELQGALVFQNMQCRNCHAIAGEGGHRGPDLTQVATRMTNPQLVRQVIQGGGNMPAFGKNLSPEQTRALVAYLCSLHPPNVPPAREAVGVLKPIGENQPTPSPTPGNVAVRGEK